MRNEECLGEGTIIVFRDSFSEKLVTISLDPKNTPEGIRDKKGLVKVDDPEALRPVFGWSPEASKKAT